MLQELIGKAKEIETRGYKPQAAIFKACDTLTIDQIEALYTETNQSTRMFKNLQRVRDNVDPKSWNLGSLRMNAAMVVQSTMIVR